MKKFIFAIILGLISIMSYCQEGQWYDIYKKNDICLKAAQSDGFMHLIIFNKFEGEGVSQYYDYHKIDTGCKFSKLVEILTLGRDKWIQYDKIAAENNIDKVDKTIDNMVLLGMYNSIWGEESFNWGELKYIKDGEHSYVTLNCRKVYDSTMWYGVKLTFETIDSLNEVIEVLSNYDNILNITGEYTKNNDLFN